MRLSEEVVKQKGTRRKFPLSCLHTDSKVGFFGRSFPKAPIWVTQQPLRTNDNEMKQHVIRSAKSSPAQIRDNVRSTNTREEEPSVY